MDLSCHAIILDYILMHQDLGEDRHNVFTTFLLLHVYVLNEYVTTVKFKFQISICDSIVATAP